MRGTVVAGIAFDTLRIGAELRHYEKTMAKVEREIGEHPATEDLRSKLADALADVATVAEEIGRIAPEIGNAVDFLASLTRRTRRAEPSRSPFQRSSSAP